MHVMITVCSDCPLMKFRILRTSLRNL